MAGSPSVRERLWSLERDAVVVHADLERSRSGRCRLHLRTGDRVFARSVHEGVLPALTLSNQICDELRREGWRSEP
jgi:hypothetical protein